MTPPDPRELEKALGILSGFSVADAAIVDAITKKRKIIFTHETEEDQARLADALAAIRAHITWVHIQRWIRRPKVAKLKPYKIESSDFLPPFKIAGNRTPRQFAAELAEMAQMHRGYGWAWHFQVAAYMLAFFAPGDAEWEKHFGKAEPVEGIDPHSFSEAAADLLKYNYWKPLFQLPYKRRVEMKLRSGETSIHDSSTHTRDHWEDLGFIAWREIRPTGDEVRLPMTGQKPSKDKPSFADTLAVIREEKEARAKAPEAPKKRQLFFNGEPIPSGPIIPAKPARPRLEIPADKPILEAPAASKRPRLPLEPPKPAKAPRPRLGSPRSLFDEED